MKKHYLLAMLAMAFAGLSSTAFADAPRYDYLSLAYTNISDPSGSGLYSDHSYDLDGSYAFTEHLLGSFDFSHEHADSNSFGYPHNFSGEFYGIGVGYRIPQTSSIDIILSLEWAYDNSGPYIGAYSSAAGYGGSIALRAMVTDSWEFDAGAIFFDGSAGDQFHSLNPVASDDSVRAGVRYYITQKFAVGLECSQNTSGDMSSDAWTLNATFFLH